MKSDILAFLDGEIRYDQRTTQGVATRFNLTFVAASDILAEMTVDGLLYVSDYRFWTY
jgi:hypothetical protein